VENYAQLIFQLSAICIDFERCLIKSFIIRHIEFVNLRLKGS